MSLDRTSKKPFPESVTRQLPNAHASPGLNKRTLNIQNGRVDIDFNWRMKLGWHIWLLCLQYVGRCILEKIYPYCAEARMSEADLQMNENTIWTLQYGEASMSGSLLKLHGYSKSGWRLRSTGWIHPWSGYYVLYGGDWCVRVPNMYDSKKNGYRRLRFLVLSCVCGEPTKTCQHTQNMFPFFRNRGVFLLLFLA